MKGLMAPLWLGGYKGCAEYLSILNKNISDFYMTMEISPGVRGSSWTLSGLDGRKPVQNILSVVFYMQPYEENGTISSKLLENTDALPFGFTYSAYMREEEFRKLNAPAKDTAILWAVVLETEEEELPELETAGGVIQLKTKTMYENLETKEGIYRTKENNKIVLQITDGFDGELYVKFNNFYFLSEFIRSMRIENKTLQMLHKDYHYQQFGQLVSDYWVKVDLQDNKNYVEMVFLPGQTYVLGGMEAYSRSVDKDSYYIEKLKDDVLKNLKFNIDTIEGTLKLKDKKILFLSIPYGSGWTAYVNGEEKELLKANIGFSALSLEPGDYNIKLVYRMPGLAEGTIITSLGILILFLLWINGTRKRKKIIYENAKPEL